MKAFTFSILVINMRMKLDWSCEYEEKANSQSIEKEKEKSIFFSYLLFSFFKDFLVYEKKLFCSKIQACKLGRIINSDRVYILLTTM